MENKLFEIISEHFGIPLSEITPDIELRRDLNATDLDIADFFQKLEEVFAVAITKEDAVNLQTVQDIINFFSDHVEEIA